MSTSAGAWYPRSFVLTDVVGSVSLWERDAGLMSRAMALHDAIIGREVVAAGGTLVRTKGEGDSTFSVFAHPSEAVAAAGAIQGVVGAERWPTRVPMRVRAGVHTGDAEPRDGEWYGPAVNRAARLRALADGGQTLVSGVTAGLVADQLPASVRLLYRGRRVLRGIERPEEVWELVAADDPRLAGPRAPRVGDLPLALTRFVGRTEDLERLAGLVENERLVTLTGPGGSGKTRLALELARDATRRGELVWLAKLAPLRDAGLVAEAVAAAVGAEPGPDPLDRLLAEPALLAGILVLDNCEHLLDACAALTGRLLAVAPELRIVTTSREPLGLAGERVWPVRPLAVPDDSLRNREQLAQVESVQLLLDRGLAARPDLEVGDDQVRPVVHICRALDGIPLAIELAAGRLRSMSFADLAAHLGDQMGVLARHRSAGGDDVRHQTLRMTLDWSHDLLTEGQQTLAQRLSVFAGGFRLDAVEALCGDDLDVLDGVDELVAKSLVTFDGTTARYRLLEPLRQYLAQRLEESGRAEAGRRAHAEWVAGLCDRLGTRLLEDQKRRSLRLREESANIDLALRWALDNHDDEIALRIVGSLGQYWYFYDQDAGRRWCAEVIESGAGATPARTAQALLSAGMVAQHDDDWDRSIALIRAALAIYRAQDTATGQAASLYWLGWALTVWPDPGEGENHGTEATRCFEESLRLFTRFGERVWAGWCRIALSVQALMNEDLDRSEQLAHQVVQECSAAGARHPVGQALCNLAYVAHRRGRDAAALEFLQDAAALYRDLDDPWQLAVTLGELAAQAAVAGRGTDGLRALVESVRFNQQIGRLPGRSNLLAVAAVVHQARGQTTLASAALGAFDAYPARRAVRPTRGSAPWRGGLAGLVEMTRARLDPAEVAAATDAARRRSIDQLIDELIIQPAKEPV